MMRNFIANLKTKFNSRREEGFTLTELLIAIGVFGVLTAIAVPVYISYQHAVDESSLKSGLLNASIIVEQEQEQELGLYPNYKPADMSDDSVMKNYIYTFSDDRLAYCVEGKLGSFTRYIGSATKGEVSATSCALPNVGGPQTETSVIPSGPPVSRNPIIVSLSPVSQVGLNGGQVVTVTGSGFTSGAKVVMGGVEMPTVYADSGSLTYTVPATFTTYGKVQVQVKNSSVRISNVVEYEFIDPITQYTIPNTITSSRVIATTGKNTITATVPTCPANATAYYSWKFLREGDTYDTSGYGLTYTNSTATPTELIGTQYWSTQRVLTFYPGMGQFMEYIVYEACKDNTSGAYSKVKASANTTYTNPIYPQTALTITAQSGTGLSFAGDSSSITWSAYTCPTGTTLKEYSIRRYAATGLISEVATTLNTTYSWTIPTTDYLYRTFVYPRCETRFTSGTQANASVTSYVIIPQTLSTPTSSVYVISKAALTNITVTATNSCRYGASAPSSTNWKYATPITSLIRVNLSTGAETTIPTSSSWGQLTSTGTINPTSNPAYTWATGTYQVYYTQYCKSDAGVSSPVQTSPRSATITINP